MASTEDRRTPGGWLHTFEAGGFQRHATPAFIARAQFHVLNQVGGMTQVVSFILKRRLGVLIALAMLQTLLFPSVANAEELTLKVLSGSETSSLTTHRFDFTGICFDAALNPDTESTG
ncbi:MAG: hypothetical protein O2856_02330 [Planctomycetota bacterium]|nr:hypothetical protein [Planctomycetota bacterium]